MEVAICYGSYYRYLRPSKRTSNFSSAVNIEPEIQIFADGEIAVEFPDSIRGKRVFIFGDGVNNLHELLMTINAARRSSAGEINVVFPYYPYGRQDKRGKTRSSMGAEVIATILQSLGVSRIITVDLHADQIQLAYGKAKVEHLSGKFFFINEVEEILKIHSNDDVVFASPDTGGTVRVKDIATMFNRGFVIIDKDRTKPNEVNKMVLLGDVKNKIILLRDDIVDTGGTLIKAVAYLTEMGAKKVYVLITHPVLSNKAAEKLITAGINLITTNTRKGILPYKDHSNFKIIDCSDILINAIFNVSSDKSVSDLM